MEDIGLFDRARTASDMDRTLHTDLAAFDNLEVSKKSYEMILTTKKS